MSSTSEVDYNKLVVIGIGAIVASIIANVAIYFITEFLGLFPVTIINPASQMSIDAFNVLFLTGFTATGGVVVYALLGKFTSQPVKYFRILGVAFYVLNFIPVIMIPNVVLTVILSLYAMHTAEAIIVIGLLTTQAVK